MNGDAVGRGPSLCRGRCGHDSHQHGLRVWRGAPSPPVAETPTAPLGAYGRTKLAGEQAFLASGVSGAIVRVAWLYDAEATTMNTMLRLAQTHGALRVVNDQHGVPTSVPVLAEALLDGRTGGGLAVGHLAVRPSGPHDVAWVCD